MTNFILLQAQGAQGTGMSTLIMIVLLIVIFYFFMIRPQQRKQKELTKFRESIEVGQQVVTAGGIYGKVRRIKPTTFVIEVSPSVLITVDKGSVYKAADEVVLDEKLQDNK